MTDPLDLDAIEAREARHGAFYLTPHEQERAFAELRTARAQIDAVEGANAVMHDRIDALEARIEAAVARCRDSIAEPAVEPHAKSQARYVLRVLVDAQTPEDMAAALSGATEPADPETTP